MKKLLVVTLVGLAISFALPTYAQQNNVADLETTSKILAIFKALNEAQENHDPAAYAAKFTRDALFVTPTGPIIGRQAIQKYYTDQWQRWHPIAFGGSLDGDVFHIIGTAGNEARATGEWIETGQGKNGELITIKGYWSDIYVCEGDDWTGDRVEHNPGKCATHEQEFSTTTGRNAAPRPPALAPNNILIAHFSTS
jgi:ketosteroid isomerase-like protein